MPSHKGTYKAKEVRPIADDLVQSLARDGMRTELCGSLRRGRDVVGDIDIVVNGSVDRVREVLIKSHGEGKHNFFEMSSTKSKKKMDFLVYGVPFNLYVADEENWGAMIMFLTGSPLFNILMRGRAKSNGWKLSQYGVFHGDEIIAGRTEEQIFYVLGVPYHSPQERDLVRHTRNCRLKETSL